MNENEAIEIAKAFGVSTGHPFDDHTFKAIFSAGDNRSHGVNAGEDVWDVWVTYNPFKGLMTPDSCVIEVNCRTGEASLIKLA